MEDHDGPSRDSFRGLSERGTNLSSAPLFPFGEHGLNVLMRFVYSYL
jgi:hypothetical protein